MTLGTNGTLKVVATNNSTGTSKETVVSVTLPDTFTVVSTDPASTATEDGVEFSLGELAGGQSQELLVTVTPTQPGVLTASVSISCLNAELDPTNNSASLEFDLTDACKITGITNGGGITFDCYPVGLLTAAAFGTAIGSHFHGDAKFKPRCEDFEDYAVGVLTDGTSSETGFSNFYC